MRSILFIGLIFLCIGCKKSNSTPGSIIAPFTYDFVPKPGDDISIYIVYNENISINEQYGSKIDNATTAIDAGEKIGNGGIYYEDGTIYPEYYMDVPEFSGCIAFRAYSDSMEKLIRPGTILFGFKLDEWRDHLEYGQIYGITCTDGRRYLKYIRRAENHRECFLLRSENKNYDDFDMPKMKIKNIWQIDGWIDKRT